MLVRLHAGKVCRCYPYSRIADIRKGFLHPIIHLGFGVEFKQPAIIAEALAQAAAHDTWIGPLLFAAEKSATPEKSKPMVEILDEIRADTKLSMAAHWEDRNKIRDGLLVRAPDEMIEYASQWNVKSDELEAKTAEMTNAAGISYFLLSKCTKSDMVVGQKERLKSKQRTSLEVLSIPPNKSSSISTTCMPSTARYSRVRSSNSHG